jgi:copper chaperone
MTTTTTTYSVNGMTCGGCVRNVKAAISTVEGVTDVQIDFKNRQAIVTSDSVIDDAAVKAAVDEAGYEVAT